MSTFQLILVGGLALGVLQIAAGIAIGLWIARKGAESAKPSATRDNSADATAAEDRRRATQLAADLQGLTATLASSVRKHNAAIDAVDKRLRKETQDFKEQAPLASGQAAPLTSLIVGVVGEILSSNQQLQKDLVHAEAELDRQADELAEQRRQSLTDPLTGLPNRRALDDHLRNRLDAWRKHRSPFSLLMLDIDHFKRLNDSYGHQAGDAALVAFGQAISAGLRKHDVVARFGGEEFAVLLPYTSLEEASAAVDKVSAQIAQLEVAFDGHPMHPTASGGLASIAPHESADSIIGRADAALYAAKQNGRDRTYYHDGVEVGPLDDADFAAHPLSENLRDACEDLQAGLATFMAE